MIVSARDPGGTGGSRSSADAGATSAANGLHGLQAQGESSPDRTFGESLKRFFSRTEWKVLGRNRRAFVRHTCEFPVEMHLDEPGLVKIVTARARDISNGGMRIECDTIPRPGTLRCLEFRFPQWSAPGEDEAWPVTINAEVRHAEPEQRTFGVAFTVPLGLALQATS